MIKVKISNNSPDWPLLRQTPGGKGIWGNCQFFVNEEIDECDYWVVYEGLNKMEEVVCPTDHVILITGEPPSVKKYHPKFLNQFHLVITCHQEITHPNVIHYQQALPWMVGRNQKNDQHISFSKNYDELLNMNYPPKDKLLSVIVTNKEFTEGHKRRVKFVNELYSSFGNTIDIYGRGIKEIPDKWEAIYPYKYHITIENSSYPDYWTEKLSDVFLGGAYPIYYGCTNIYNYFSKNSLTSININNIDESIDLIVKAVSDNIFEKNYKEIMISKNKILNEYNLFPMICNIIEKRKDNLMAKRNTKIIPEHYFNESSFSKIKKYFSYPYHRNIYK